MFDSVSVPAYAITDVIGSSNKTSYYLTAIFFCLITYTRSFIISDRFLFKTVYFQIHCVNSIMVNLADGVEIVALPDGLPLLGQVL